MIQTDIEIDREELESIEDRVAGAELPRTRDDFDLSYEDEDGDTVFHVRWELDDFLEFDFNGSLSRLTDSDMSRPDFEKAACSQASKQVRYFLVDVETLIDELEDHTGEEIDIESATEDDTHPLYEGEMGWADGFDESQ